MTLEHDRQAKQPPPDLSASQDNINTEAKRVINLVDKGDFHHAADALRADSKLLPEQRQQFFQALKSEAATGHHVHPLTITGLDSEKGGINVTAKSRGKEQRIYQGAGNAKPEGGDPAHRAQEAVDGRTGSMPLLSGEGPFQMLMRMHPDMDQHQASVMARQMRDASGKTSFNWGDRLDTLSPTDKQKAVDEQTKQFETQDRQERIKGAVDRFRADPAKNEVPKFGEMLGLKEDQVKSILDAQKNDPNYKGKLFGDIAIDKGFITRDDQHAAENLQRDLRSEKAIAQFKADPTKEPPGPMQVLGLAPFEIKKAESTAATQTKPISDVVVDLGYRTKEQVTAAFQTAGALQKEHLDKVGD